MKNPGMTAARWSWLAAASAGLVLAGCGQMPPPVDTNQTIIEVPDNATPGVTEDVARRTQEATVSVVNGKISPNRVEGLAGKAFTLNVKGDGTQHTFEIDTLLEPDVVKADGTSTFQFEVDGTPQDVNIKIDGKNAGTFTIMEAGGVSDE